jgi:hypothetical protein
MSGSAASLGKLQGKTRNFDVFLNAPHGSRRLVDASRFQEKRKNDR